MTAILNHYTSCGEGPKAERAEKSEGLPTFGVQPNRGRRPLNSGVSYVLYIYGYYCSYTVLRSLKIWFGDAQANACRAVRGGLAICPGQGKMCAPRITSPVFFSN